jgi:hypothetical protein
MLATPETPAHVLLESYATRCAMLARECKDSRTQRLLKLLAVDLLIEADRQRKRRPITALGLSSFEQFTAR